MVDTEVTSPTTTSMIGPTPNEKENMINLRMRGEYR